MVKLLSQGKEKNARIRLDKTFLYERQHPVEVKNIDSRARLDRLKS